MFVSPTERTCSAVPPEESFLQRLMERGATESSNSEEMSNVESGLASRKAMTIRTMKNLLQAIDAQRGKNDEISAAIRNIVSPHGKYKFWLSWTAFMPLVAPYILRIIQYTGNCFGWRRC